VTAPASVVCLGELMLDVVALLTGPLAVGSDTPARISTAGGGSAANVAAWLGALGTPVAFVGRVGDDPAGRACRAALAAGGVQVRVAVDPRRPTGTCIVLVGADGERSMLPDPGASLALSPVDVPAGLLVAGAHLHVSGYSLLRAGSRAAAQHALRLADANGMTTSVDPSSVGLLAAYGPAAFLAAVRGVDLLLPNAAEAALLSGEADAERAARRLAELAGVREVVLTLGADGALAVSGDDPVVRVPAAAAPVLDTTGAGDAFTAGLLDARRRGLDLPAALAAGAATAARAVRHLGARPAP
jgi:sugar/nucleoside kinase (ribokinase family)